MIFYKIICKRMPLKLVRSKFSDIYHLKCSARRYSREIREIREIREKSYSNYEYETQISVILNRLIYIEELMTKSEESDRMILIHDKLYDDSVTVLNSSISYLD